jgi:hypothetical protein
MDRALLPCRQALLPVLTGLLLAVVTPAPAVQRETFRDVRGRYERMTLRLRIDLRKSVNAAAPNVISLDGVGYGSERAPVLFGRLERVFIDRVTDEGGTRMTLTVYRSQEEARTLRATDIPQPGNPNPLFGSTMAMWAQGGSTSVELSLKTGKKDQAGQLAEIEALLDRVFYVSGDPPRLELEDYVRRHRGASIGRLRDLTGLTPEEIRAIVEEPAAP